MNELESLKSIFKDRIFKIPDYQRGYAWSTKQLKDFWEDVINLPIDRYHYTGVLSLKTKMEYFNVEFLEECKDFFDELNLKTQKKIFYNIDKATQTLDPELFKKLTSNIWEFRSLINKTCYRLLSFWDKTDNKNTLVICTHGFIKKTQKTPQSEIDKAERIMKLYFQELKKNKKY